MKKVIHTPIQDEEIKDLRVGDIIYLTGTLVTCRDDGHRRVIEEGVMPELPLDRIAILHAGPIVQEVEGGWKMISVGPTTSMRMERYEKEFLEKTGVKLVIGKGGMGNKTAQGCKESVAIHAIFPGGCAVIAAEQVEEIEGLEWPEFGMPEAFWILRVKEFGPLIVSIDTEGNNFIEEKKNTFRERQKEESAKVEKFVASFMQSH
ncbi:L(+)-tartrate dehydratase subunit beta [Wolinella succinogenes]|uniref:L(+)-tartrate dehydratase subunit beta n=1 Tax=Wolinella succinogenes (strain ATCC 29543 / DSM 1740 / CCUG 13145 / JCM 31913 / LMG 7466 / NCTC 11488 / FDC 602W) TaxID=273121 RepID=Q7M8N5_WOLSU|nr:L(+)-tartrate dehydratase subunit beta [Wolinella succinogenes]NLU35080.1 L(+)-tartrate dehydratase subunit beta [Wolinella succinogenes]CAE10575.1 L-TARTRATE DEHYDRATASE, SUBUNIT B [Wolinella succinogenes]VEG80720.1 L(+)-tartrate dehydratase subunit beta [Wolinella succinogenes]HCZ18747.1 L(+)-tartrate dehydratase subunit beta [Helicobacter sp.]